MGDPFRKVDPNSFLIKLFGGAEYLEDMDPDTPQKVDMQQRGYAVGRMITKIVHMLRSDIRLPERLRMMAALLWNLIGNRVTPTAMTEVPSLYFAHEGNQDGLTNGVILVPMNWVELVRENPILQVGGMCFVGSRARDYFNGKIGIHDLDSSTRRAYAFEAEFLNFIKVLEPSWTPDEYQSKVMTEYPKGLDSLKSGLWYESKPYRGE